MKQQATPYLIFNGNARQALELYKEVFQGEVVELQTYGEADFPTPPEADDLIIHAKFRKDSLFLMISDVSPNQPYETGNNISLVLELESKEEIQHIYTQLSQKGSILMELQDTFWGAKYAKVQDPFGVIWDLNYTKA
ncbi:VOC family protein [Peribacillus asahii]|uniref:Glyoxalase n=1 Tax=Peribacillus asahii TaxID=228899 RepID=A0A3Q9RNU7_9BACI|nr:VOC family protein [Peribacillus asahii]AZV42974.1 glyoxalase [Peribacillus asahii]USK87168.1 VOC family protein [Peribacillus asahii]